MRVGSDAASRGESWSTRIRTWTNRTKTCCATVTPSTSGRLGSGSPLLSRRRAGGSPIGHASSRSDGLAEARIQRVRGTGAHTQSRVGRSWTFQLAACGKAHDRASAKLRSGEQSPASVAIGSESNGGSLAEGERGSNRRRLAAFGAGGARREAAELVGALTTLPAPPAERCACISPGCHASPPDQSPECGVGRQHGNVRVQGKVEPSAGFRREKESGANESCSLEVPRRVFSLEPPHTTER